MYKMSDGSTHIIDKLLQYFYTGDYTRLSEEDDSAYSHMSALQLHARLFAMADKYNMKDLCALSAEKYSSRLEKDFNIIEFLESSPDVYHLTAPQVQTLRNLVLHFARKNLENALHHSLHSKIYDDITCEVPTFTKDLLNSYIASPIGQLSELWANNGHAGVASSMPAVQPRKGVLRMPRKLSLI
ncbi:uncharacterized protein P174DRAFT_502313 [Aspergillus novofumigatus IBT 16806]|uniref:BTB domain-containing protein n=1 Tax=Aspergillus novofumigatus (strain IBT 16806) TaxID=1392255 RepID=A0A2I1CJN1_ASPN1|nr:uncharacterized protein P174DRAFT_502313 [Aspergillus novofumigatus IBT 16806]PKX97833.1 hypothetical protein P174DRAFT_502313 [Aspergillus novofumigatus IBT 16806]